MSIQLLTPDEIARLKDLIDIQNTATQVDGDEADELQGLLGRLFNDGDPVVTG